MVETNEEYQDFQDENDDKKGKKSKKLKAVTSTLMTIKQAVEDAAAEQSDPLGSLQQFLNKERFEMHYARAKEALMSEERAGGVYNAKDANEAFDKSKRKLRKWVFVIIGENQVIHEKANHTSYAGLKRNTLANQAAVFL